MKKSKHPYLLLIPILLSCAEQKVSTREYIDLEGQWQFALDTANLGVQKEWYLSDLGDFISLPGTTDSNQKGFLNLDTTTLHLNRVYKYEGPAWYRKKVYIPESFDEKHIQLSLERTKISQVWVDSTRVGESKILQSPQRFDLTNHLTPGTHYLTIRIDNDLKLTPYGNVHIYSDDTQTNWNGIIGNIYLEATPKTYISNLQIYPDIDHKKIDIKLEIDNQLNFEELEIELRVERNFNGNKTQLKTKKTNTVGKEEITLEYFFDDEVSLWDEYKRPIYQLTIIISNKNIMDSKTVSFGMREFSAKGTQFTINGRTVFLRGKHESAVFLLTGHTPMNVGDWSRIYKISKSYGINHYRFHSYCPPEAAFIAADQEGIYLQAELPFWGGLNSDTVAQMLKAEGIAMMKAYGNHPSFVMFSPGNELWGGHDKVEKIMLDLKAYDDRPLYTMGSNNNIGYLPPKDYAEFFVGARIPDRGDSTIGHTRLTHAFADSRNGGILNTQTPSTKTNFDYPVSKMELPIVSHEIGQYQIYPDYDEIEKYTGVLKPRNLEVFQKRLAKKGMAEMDSAFQKASGAWSALCYKAEMEAAIRTKGFAGFQLLDLQDFPGQGTALVGILDAFMDSKDVISPEVWRQSCNDVVLLSEFPKYCWTNTENFGVNILVANYSDKTIQQDLQWELKKQEGTILNQGTFKNETISQGGIKDIGRVRIDLSLIQKAEKLSFELNFPGTDYSNSYAIWVYPEIESIEGKNEITIIEQLDSKVLEQLQVGAKVLFFPQTEDIEENSFPGHFPPDFWNYGMFKSISENVNKSVSPGTLGLMTNPEHPIFNDFPTDFHTNWQWFSIIKASNSLILDDTSNDYLPIVQVIDNLERNHKLGLICERKVGKGKLIVCMSQLNKLMDNPEAIQLYQSIINYMNSDEFDPAYEVSNEELFSLFN